MSHSDRMSAAHRLRFQLHARTRRHQFMIRLARERVGEWLALVERPYVAFSTGKDSTCVLSLVREQRPDTPAVYFDADCAYPESATMIAVTPGVMVWPADEPLLDTLARYGLEAGAELEQATMRTTVWGPIRRLLAAHAFDGTALGLRAAESFGRRLNARTKGAVYRYKRDGVWACQPIFDWSYDDVWSYIVANDLTYCGVYDKQWDMPEANQRLSYWAGESNRQFGRYAWLRRHYPELFNRLAAQFPEARNYV